MNVQKFLKSQGVPFDVVEHRPTFDAQRMSQAMHVSGHHVAKTVLLRLPHDRYAVAVLPAADEVDLSQVAELLGVDWVELANEEELANCFPDCEVGARPPFGSQYHMQTVVDGQLTKDRDILFEGNRHDEAIKMNYVDFERLEQPLVGSFSLPMTPH